mgnify:CR=1 FL=1
MPNAINKDIHFLDFLDIKRLENILQSFTNVTGVASIITNIRGQPITKEFNFSSLCSNYCRSTEEGRYRCYKSDRYGGQQSTKKKKMVIYTCLNAELLDSAYPITVGNYHLANFLCGQVLEEPIAKERALLNAQKIGIQDIDGYLDELSNIPIMSKKRLQAIVNLMVLIIETISELALSKYLCSRQSDEYLNTLINSVCDCILAVDDDGYITMCNNACKKLFGLLPNDIIGKDIVSIFPKNKYNYIKDHYINNMDLSYHHFHTEVVDKDKHSIPVKISTSKTNADNKHKSNQVCVIRNISEEKKLEQMKDDITGMMTHDLKNPVISIHKALELLQNKNIGPINGQQKKIIDMTLKTSSHLYSMIDDYLDIYRNEAGYFSLNKTNFDLQQMISESFQHTSLYAMDKKIDVRWDFSPEKFTIHADRNRLFRVLINLLENAIKYSPEKGIIYVESYGQYGHKFNESPTLPQDKKTYVHPDQQYFLIKIADQGVGIPAQFQDQIFNKFYTVKKDQTVSRKGYGLGLAFCKLTVTSHAGLIWVKSPLFASEPNKRKGCSFNMIIPARERPFDIEEFYEPANISRLAREE